MTTEHTHPSPLALVLPSPWTPVRTPRPADPAPPAQARSFPRHELRVTRLPARSPRPLPPTPGGATAGAGLTAAAAARHGVTLHRREDLLTILRLEDTEFDALVADGALLEVAIGGGLSRYAFTTDLTATTSTRQGRA